MPRKPSTLMQTLQKVEELEVKNKRGRHDSLIDTLIQQALNEVEERKRKLPALQSLPYRNH